jgi:hypothetical protein
LNLPQPRGLKRFCHRLGANAPGRPSPGGFF